MHLDGDAYEHSNLVLATVLLMKGHEGELVQKGAQALWRYPLGSEMATEDQLLISRQFANGECRVEPVAFARCLRRVRGKMYDLLGMNTHTRTSS